MGEKKPTGFLLFFLRNKSSGNAIGDFTVKTQNWEGNRYLTENRLSRNEMWCAVVNHNHMRHICAKGFLNLNFNYAVIDKILIFHEIAPNFTYSQKL